MTMHMINIQKITTK